MTHIFSGVKPTSLFVVFPLLIVIALVFPAPTSLGKNRAKSSAKDAPFKIITVFLVRHAEKEATPPQDPALTEAGKERSQTLMRMLSSAGIKTILTTQFLRTRHTAEPLAKQLGIELTVLPIKMDGMNPRQISNQSYEEVVAKVYERAGESLLIVGHSNTVPEIIKRLGGDLTPNIDEKEFDDLFVVTIYAKGKAKVLPLKYGNSNKAP